MASCATGQHAEYIHITYHLLSCCTQMGGYYALIPVLVDKVVLEGRLTFKYRVEKECITLVVVLFE